MLLQNTLILEISSNGAYVCEISWFLQKLATVQTILETFGFLVVSDKYIFISEYPEIVEKLINISGFPTDVNAIKKLFSRYPLGAAYMFFYQVRHFRNIRF